jgi:multidrug efflux pump subunit AcrB
VLAALNLLCGVGAAIVIPKDVLPEVNIPVVVIVWTCTGEDTLDMEKHITNNSEISLSNNVNNIQRIESTTLQGTAIERVYFQPGVSVDLAISQIVSATDAVRAVLPTGIQPPVMIRFSASSVPVLQ